MAAGDSSTGRVLWIIFCCVFAFVWFLIGFATLGIGWLMVPVSLLAILIPVGKVRSRLPSAGWYGQPTQYWQPQPYVQQPVPTAGWYPDPTSPGGSRWWDGTKWTEHTTGTSWPPPSVGQDPP